MNPLDEFLAMKKEAGWLSDAAKAFGKRFPRLAAGGKALAEGAGKAVPPVAVGLGIGAGITGAEKGIRSIQERFGKQKDFQAMMSANPHLEKMDAGNVQLTYNSLRKAAPSIASDPLMAGSFVRRTLEMSDPPYVDAQTIKMLTDAQKNISQARGGSGAREFAMGAAAKGAMS
jgi:hypothetical protein